MVYNSNAIENSTLTLKDTEDILLRDIVRKDRDIREVYEAKNLARIMEALLAAPSRPLSVPLLLEWHKALLTGINDACAGRLTSLLALLLIESLHKRIAYLTSRRIVPLSGWANAARLNPSTVLNKAKRQTLPAFRVRGKWMIGADYELPADQRDPSHT